MATRKKRKAKRGGKRPGAGRTGFIADARRLSVDYPGEDLEALEEIAEAEGVSLATIVRRAVRQFLDRQARR